MSNLGENKWSFLSRWGLVTLKKRCVVSAARATAHTRKPPRADCRAACACSRDTLKPERRWCHGPDVKKKKKNKQGGRWRFFIMPSQHNYKASKQRMCTQTERLQWLPWCPGVLFSLHNYSGLISSKKCETAWTKAKGKNWNRMEELKWHHIPDLKKTKKKLFHCLFGTVSQQAGQ